MRSGGEWHDVRSQRTRVHGLDYMTSAEEEEEEDNVLRILYLVVQSV